MMGPFCSEGGGGDQFKVIEWGDVAIAETPVGYPIGTKEREKGNYTASKNTQVSRDCIPSGWVLLLTDWVKGPSPMVVKAATLQRYW